jgi:hypothetical protein
MLNTEPETMSGGPYIYDRELKKFVMRPSSEPQREPLPDLPDEVSLPPPRIKPSPSRERRKLIVWLASACLFLAWLILLTVWTRRTSLRVEWPVTSSRPAPAEFPREDFGK